MMWQFPERRFWLVVSVVVLATAALAAGSAWQESQTFDEVFHLTSGYRYLRTGRFTMNLEHPPLQNVLNAAPLLFLNPPLPADEALKDDQYGTARAFLYRGPIHADRLLFPARLMSIAVLGFLVFNVAGLTRKLFGNEAGLFAAVMTAFDPNLLAHGHYVTTDMSCAAFFYLTGVLWVVYLEGPSKAKAAGVAIATGLGLTSKFSMVLMLPILVLLMLVHSAMNSLPLRTWEQRIGALLLVYTGALGMVVLIYAPDTWNVWKSGGVEGIPMPFLAVFEFLRGVIVPIVHQQMGHESYLLGKTSMGGSWYYFPVALAVKSTTATLLALVLAAGLGIWKLPRLFKDRAQSAKWVALLVPPAIFFAIVLRSNINIGVRHILPVFAYLYMLSAAAILRSLPRKVALTAAICLAGLQAVETVWAYPDFVAFFNAPSGGSKAGTYYLRDSNLDWGQDLKKLKDYVDKEKPERLCLDYFGFADPKYYGISSVEFPKTWESKAREDVDCIGALSVTAHANLYRVPESYEWLRKKSPMGMVGKSIYLYDLRKSKGNPALRP